MRAHKSTTTTTQFASTLFYLNSDMSFLQSWRICICPGPMMKLTPAIWDTSPIADACHAWSVVNFICHLPQCIWELPNHFVTNHFMQKVSTQPSSVGFSENSVSKSMLKSIWWIRLIIIFPYVPICSHIFSYVPIFSHMFPYFPIFSPFKNDEKWPNEWPSPRRWRESHCVPPPIAARSCCTRRGQALQLTDQGPSRRWDMVGSPRITKEPPKGLPRGKIY